MYIVRRAALATVVLIFLLSQSNCNALSNEGNQTQSASPPQSLSNGTTTTSDDISPSGKPEEVQNKPADKHTKNGKPEAALYFEISKRMNEYNLSLDDIRQVLSQVKDDDQFSYMLADKLGYIVKGNYDDPHIPVIKSRKDDLVTLLKEREMLLSPPLKTSDQDSSVSTDPPKYKTPVRESKGRISFKIANKIQSLEVDAIIDLLNDYTLSGSLRYALGTELGYSDEDEQMKYLENADEEELRKQLQQVLKLKMADRNEPTSEIVKLPNQHEGRGGNEPQETEMPPYQVKKVDVSSGGATLGSIARSSLKNLGNDNNEPTNDGNTQAVKNEESEPQDPSQNHDNQSQSKVTEAADQSAVSVPEESPSVNKQEPEDLNAKHSKNHNNDVNLHSNSDGKWISELAFFEDENFMAYLKSDHEDLYDELSSRKDEPADEDDSVIIEAMDEYRKWTEGDAKNVKEAKSDVANQEGNPTNLGNSGGEGSIHVQPVGGGGVKQPDGGEGEKQPDGGEGEKQPDGGEGEKQPDGGEGEKQAVGAEVGEGAEPPANLDEKQSSVSDDDEEYVPSSSFGAWHFISIFLILGAVVVIGYLCMHNRKKLREGVASYVNDSSKRRRRAREYKPLMST